MNRREQVAYWGGAVLIALFSSAIIVNTTFLQPQNLPDGKGVIMSSNKGVKVPRALPLARTHVRVQVPGETRTARRDRPAARHTASISRNAQTAQYSPLIANVQRKLAKMGYDPGPVDGRLGPSTRRAIMQFQRANNMPATGEIEPGVMALLLP